MSKRIILSDSSLNRNGYRVLTEGIDYSSFEKNPILLYMHLRDEGSPLWGNYKAIGHWEDLKVEDGVLTAEPVFDKADELSRTVAAKFEAGTFNAASIGIRILATSSEKEYLLPGQTRETVTRCELMEASIVDIPANRNAVRLYDKDASVSLSIGKDNEAVPLLKFYKPMNLKAKWKTVLSFLGIGEDKAEATQLSEEQMESLNGEMGRLQEENDRLASEKEKANGDLQAANDQVSTLKADIEKKNGEISTLKNDLSAKDAEIRSLKEQVQNLKNQPDDKGAQLTPKQEPGTDEKEDLAAFSEKHSDDYATLAARIKEEGLI